MSEEAPPKRRYRKRDVVVDESELTAERPKRERRARQIPTIPETVKWSTQEKERLIEGLYRHSPLAVESVSNVVGTKTPQEVENFIEKTIDSACLESDKRKINVDVGAAPLELWLGLLQELVQRDKKVDHSAQYAKALRVITRNEEMPEDSGFANLNWRNLYSFLCDLLDDKAVIGQLSNMESLVMLDMMHSLGDSLHSLDTNEQRKLLDLKYQLYRWEKTKPSESYTAGLKAHNTDFTEIEYTTPGTATSSNVQDSTSFDKPGPSSSTCLQPDNQLPSTSSSTLDPISNSWTATTSQTFAPFPKFQKSRVTNIPPTSTVPSISAPEHEPLTSHESISSDNTNSFNEDRPSDETETTSEASTSLTETVTDSATTGSVARGDNSTGSVLNGSHTDGSTEPEKPSFTFPKLFCLNPLTIPSNHLSFKAKEREVETEIPVLINL